MIILVLKSTDQIKHSDDPKNNKITFKIIWLYFYCIEAAA